MQRAAQYRQMSYQLPHPQTPQEQQQQLFYMFRFCGEQAEDESDLDCSVPEQICGKTSLAPSCSSNLIQHPHHDQGT